MTTLSTDKLSGPIVDTTVDETIERPPLVLGETDFMDVTDSVCAMIENKAPIGWWLALLVSVSLFGLLQVLILFLVLTGVGVWGNNIPVAWGFPIVNFVFWVGIGHAGTLISAILYLFRQKWRTAINRFAEAMTIFAVICALIWPGIHIGRPWLPYWMFPYPNQMGMWPQFRSPLLWDVFAVGTYFTVSLLFWYMGMIPDIATLRDRSKSKIRQIAYGVFSLGWRGSNRHWHRYERAYLLLAALATPLVLSVHSVVSFDFAVSQVPGWHSTIFPPYFVAGAVFGGFAMVILLAIPCRKWFKIEHIITARHMENMAKIMLSTGLIVSLAYATEFFVAWYSMNRYEQFTFENYYTGPYAWAFGMLMFCNVIFPQLLWFKKLRNNMTILFLASVSVTIGMWFERFWIIIMSLTRDFVPSSWGSYWPSWVDIGMFAGSFGLFFTLFLLFVRFLPSVNMAEVRAVMPQAHGEGDPWIASEVHDRAKAMEREAHS
ncbi:polysulfide reductase NrfD [Planctomycetales bacterium ZRK34]|nr:polysulfide reductase NrfD [Planctomycetales bacterium ZRK34]